MPGGSQGGNTGGGSWLSGSHLELSRRTALLLGIYIMGFYRGAPLEKRFLGVGMENATAQQPICIIHSLTKIMVLAISFSHIMWS